MRNETQQDIIILNRALDGANATERPQVERAVVRAKVALMEPLWAEDWGELKDFRDWLAKGGTPPDKTQPAGLFSTKVGCRAEVSRSRARNHDVRRR